MKKPLGLPGPTGRHVYLVERRCRADFRYQTREVVAVHEDKQAADQHADLANWRREGIAREEEYETRMKKGLNEYDPETDEYEAHISYCVAAWPLLGKPPGD